MLLAKRAIFTKLDPVWVVLFILHIVVVALLALVASQGNADSHGLNLLQEKKTIRAKTR